MLNHTIPKEWFKGCLEWSPMKSPIKNGIGETAARGRRWKQVTPREILMFWSKTMLGVYFTSNQQDSTSISYAPKWILMSFMQVKPQNWWSCHYAVTTLVPCHQGIYNRKPEESFAISTSFKAGEWYMAMRFWSLSSIVLNPHRYNSPTNLRGPCSSIVWKTTSDVLRCVTNKRNRLNPKFE